MNKLLRVFLQVVNIAMIIIKATEEAKRNSQNPNRQRNTHKPRR